VYLFHFWITAPEKGVHVDVTANEPAVAESMEMESDSSKYLIPTRLYTLMLVYCIPCMNCTLGYYGLVIVQSVHRFFVLAVKVTYVYTFF
jgi:hypothetical protein